MGLRTGASIEYLGTEIESRAAGSLAKSAGSATPLEVYVAERLLWRGAFSHFFPFRVRWLTD